MPMLRGNTPTVHLESAAQDWPDWTDAWTWELGPPTEADAVWWSEQNDTWDADDEPPDAYWDQLAQEAEAQDRIDRGLLL